MTYEFKDKVVLISGGAGGLGEATARRMFADGAKHISILDLNSEKGEQLESELNNKHGPNKVSFIKCDITNEDNVDEAFKCVISKHGYIDIVVNSAGTVQEHKHNQLVRVNMDSVIDICIKALKYMSKAHGGRGGTIINFSSISALFQFCAIPVYGATKMGILHFGMNIGCEATYAQTDVRVLTICFGKTKTNLLDNITTIDKVFQHHLETLQRPLVVQKIEAAIEAVSVAYKEGASNSVWLSINNFPAYDYTAQVQKGFAVLGDLSVAIPKQSNL